MIKTILKIGCGGIVAFFVVMFAIYVFSGGYTEAEQKRLAEAAQRTATAANTTPVPVTPTGSPPTSLAKSIPAPPTSTAGPPGIGQSMSAGNWEYKVTKVTRPRTVQVLGSASRPKGQWLLVSMVLKNIAKEPYMLNAWDFEVHKPDGTKFKMDDSAAWLGVGRKSALSGDFPPGASVDIDLLFDIAPDAGGLRLWLAQAKQYILLE